MARIRVFENQFLLGEYADLEFRCGDATFFVHRAAVCRSAMMRMTCGEGQIVGAKTIIEDNDNDSESMERLLEFFYLTKYTEPSATNSDDSLNKFSEDNPLVIHVNVRAVAEFYDIAQLKAYAVGKFAAAADSIETLDALMFTKLLRLIYRRTGETDNPLFDKVLEVAIKHKTELLRSKTFTDALIEDAKIRPFALNFIHGLLSSFEDDLEKGQNKHDDKHEEQIKSLTDELDSIKIKLDTKSEQVERQMNSLIAAKKEEAKHEEEVAKVARIEQWLKDSKATLRAREDELKAAIRTADELEWNLTRAKDELDECKTKMGSHEDVVEQLKTLYRIQGCRRCQGKFDLHRHGPNGYRLECRVSKHFVRKLGRARYFLGGHKQHASNESTNAQIAAKNHASNVWRRTVSMYILLDVRNARRDTTSIRSQGNEWHGMMESFVQRMQ